MNDKKTEIIHKEIDLIQSCINRMAQNSFLLKGWVISILAVVLAIMKDFHDPIYLSLIMLIPLISFWYLDAFFLQTEKIYRKMYEWVLEKRSQEDFSRLYDLDPKHFKENIDSKWKIMLSPSLRVFYGIPLLIVIAIFVYGLIKIQRLSN